MNEGCYDANEMQKVKILLIFSGTKSGAVTEDRYDIIYHLASLVTSANLSHGYFNQVLMLYTTFI